MNLGLGTLSSRVKILTHEYTDPPRPALSNVNVRVFLSFMYFEVKHRWKAEEGWSSQLNDGTSILTGKLY